MRWLCLGYARIRHDCLIVARLAVVVVVVGACIVIIIVVIIKTRCAIAI